MNLSFNCIFFSSYFQLHLFFKGILSSIASFFNRIFLQSHLSFESFLQWYLQLLLSSIASHLQSHLIFNRISSSIASHLQSHPILSIASLLQSLQLRLASIASHLIPSPTASYLQSHLNFNGISSSIASLLQSHFSSIASHLQSHLICNPSSIASLSIASYLVFAY